MVFQSARMVMEASGVHGVPGAVSDSICNSSALIVSGGEPVYSERDGGGSFVVKDNQ